MNSPENLVKKFILAYESWNDASFLASKNGENGRYESMKIATESYQILINTYCSKNVIPQGISFGSKSNHCLESEKIISSALSDDKAVIATKNTDTNGFVSDHEYHFEKENNEWKLRSLLYVDEDGQYECL